MFTDDNFVHVQGPNSKLETKHRRLVRNHIIENQRNKYLKVGRPGKISSTFSWRIGPAPDTCGSGTKVHSPTINSTIYAPHLTLTKSLTGNSHDPFASLPVAKRGSVDPTRTLSYVYDPDYSPALEFESSPRSNDVVHPTLDELLPMALHSPALFSAVLTDIQYWHDIKSSATDSSALLEYHGQAIVNIRSKLSTNDAGIPFLDDAIILAMTFLMGHASWSRDESSEAAHSIALQRVITSRGGIGAMTPFVESMILQYNFWLQQDRARPPLFHRHEYVNQAQRVEQPHLPFPSEVAQAWAELPPTFASLLQCWVPSVQLLDILVRTQTWTMCLGRLWLRQATHDDYATYARNDALLILEDVLHLQATTGGLKINDAAVTAADDDATSLILTVLVLYLLNTMYKTIAQSRPIYFNTRKYATATLTERLTSNPTILASPVLEQKLVVWSSMVVISSYRQENGDMDPTGTALMAALVDRWPSATHWEPLKHVLQGGFCYGATLRAWKICWETTIPNRFKNDNTQGNVT